MAEATFGVTYDGPAVAGGTMPVRDLAPALLALGDLFADASVVLFPERKPVALDIKATDEGSFVIQLILDAKGAWEGFVDIFGSQGVAALVALQSLVIGSKGLVALIKRMSGRRITNVEQDLEAGQVRLTLDDGTTFEAPADVLKLYRNVEVRKKTQRVFEPLRAGVERVDFHAQEVVTVSVTADELPAFALREEEAQALADYEVQMVVAIASVAFIEGNKWRLTSGEATFHATIEDEAFLQRVNDGVESFTKGDMLRCRMRIVQSQTTEGLHEEHHVLEVIEHIPRQIQLRLAPGDKDENETRVRFDSMGSREADSDQDDDPLKNPPLGG